MAIHAQWMVSDIAPLPFMTLFCLNFLGQFHAHPGVGTERKHLAWQLGGKGCLAVKLDIQMLPWLRSLDWCSPGVWEVIKNWTVVCQDTGCPSHPKNFCPILVTAPTPGLLPKQNKNNCRDACPLWAPVNELGTQRDPEAMCHQSPQVCCEVVSPSPVATITVVLLQSPRRNTWFWWVNFLGQ